MKTCSQCNAKNTDDALFCASCGAGINGVAPDPVVKKSPWGVRIVILAIAAVILYFIVSSIFFMINPSLRVLNGLVGLINKDKLTISATATVNYRGQTQALKILDDTTAKAKIGIDLDNVTAESSLELLYDNKPVTKIVGGISKEAYYIDPLKLYNKKFCYEMDDSVRDTLDELRIIKKATNQIHLKFNTINYAKAINDVLDDHMESSFNQVTLEVDREFFLKLLKAVFEEAADDERLKDSIWASGSAFAKELAKHEDELGMIINTYMLEDLQEAFNEDQKESYEDGYTTLLEDAADGLDATLDYLDGSEIQEYKITFKFDLFNHLSGFKVSMDTEDFDGKYTIDVDVNISNGASFTRVNPDSALSFEDITNDGDVAKDVANNIVKAVKSNKSLSNDIEDYFGVDIDDLSDRLQEFAGYGF